MLNGKNQFRSDKYLENSEGVRKKLGVPPQKKFFFHKYPQKKYQQGFCYYDLAQKKQPASQKKNFRAQKKNRNFYANLIQKNSRFSLEERIIFDRLWKGALCQTFGGLPAKQERKNCCCHCQCEVSSGTNLQLMPKKTMRSVIR